MTKLKKSLSDDLWTRFTKYEYNRILAHATYLDPRFGKNGFSDPPESSLEKIKKILFNKIFGLYKTIKNSLLAEPRTFFNGGKVGN